MKLRHLSLAGIALAVVSAAASAERLKLSDKESRQVTADYARCVVKEKPELASKAVIEDWSVEQIVETKYKLLSPDCVRAAGLISAIRFQVPNLRAALAEQLITRNPDLNLTVEPAAPLAPLAYHQPWPIRTVDDKGKPLGAKAITAQQDGYANRLALIAGQQVAECVVRANPAGVRALFATKLESDAEMEAIKALSPAFPPCVPAGKQFSFDKRSLRGSLALSYYRLAMAARGITWAGDSASTGGVGK